MLDVKRWFAIVAMTGLLGVAACLHMWMWLADDSSMMISDFIAVDRPGCGCEKCLTGEHMSFWSWRSDVDVDPTVWLLLDLAFVYRHRFRLASEREPAILFRSTSGTYGCLFGAGLPFGSTVAPQLQSSPPSVVSAPTSASGVTGSSRLSFPRIQSLERLADAGVQLGSPVAVALGFGAGLVMPALHTLRHKTRARKSVDAVRGELECLLDSLHATRSSFLIDGGVPKESKSRVVHAAGSQPFLDTEVVDEKKFSVVIRDGVGVVEVECDPERGKLMAF